MYYLCRKRIGKDYLMNRSSFDQLLERKGTSCHKYDNLQEVFGMDDLLPMWIADSDFASPDFVMKAIAKRAEHPVLGYTFRGESFNSAVKRWLDFRAQWAIKDEWIEFTPGIVCGLALAIMAYTQEGDGVLIQPPVYPPFAATINSNSRVLVENQLIIKDGKYEIDFEDFEAKLAKSKLFILCNPHNPVGRAFSHEELRRMGELCVKHGVKIVSDEIHSDLVFKPHTHIHLASISKEIADITITYIAPSKTFNIAGLATAVAIIPSAQMMEQYKTITNMVRTDLGNIFGIVALEAAYMSDGEWLENQIDYIESNFDFAVEYIKNNMPKIKAYKPEATYLLWLDFSDLGLKGMPLCEFAIKEAKLGLNPGSDFGSGGDGFMRMNLATTRCRVERALLQLKEAYQQRGY